MWGGDNNYSLKEVAVGYYFDKILYRRVFLFECPNEIKQDDRFNLNIANATFRSLQVNYDTEGVFVPLPYLSRFNGENGMSARLYKSSKTENYVQLYGVVSYAQGGTTQKMVNNS